MAAGHNGLDTGGQVCGHSLKLPELDCVRNRANANLREMQMKSGAAADIEPPSDGPPQATTLPSVFMAANEWMLVVMLTTSEKVSGPLGK